MNDRFKFRLWDVQNQKYLYFDLFDSESLNDFAFFASEEAPDYNEQIKFPDTNCWALKIEQCNGLNDKNGKLIYEGDIVKINGWWNACGPAGYDKNQTIVKWNKEFAGFEPMFIYDCDCGVYHDAEECEIIGNIHENADLLGE